MQFVFHFDITYNEDKDWQDCGATYYDNMKVIEDAEGIVFWALEKEKTYESDVNKDTKEKNENPYKGDTWDKHVQNVYIQDDGPEVGVTIEGVWFVQRTS